MKKKKIILMAALCAVAFTGCKKKDPIDLSSLHTTAAVEKETLPVTTAAETETTAASGDSEEESKSAGSSFAVKTETKSFTAENTAVEYPEISNMKDSDMLKKVNEVLRRNASAVADAYPLKPGQSLNVKSTVESANLKRLTVTYRGEIKSSDASGSEKLFFSNVIDLDTAQSLRLSDYTDAYTAAGYIASGDYKLEAVSASNEAAIRSYINASGKDTDYYYKKLSAADFSGGYTEEAGAVTWPEVFSYEKQGIIYISLPVPQELGGYAIIRYSPDNK